MASSLRSIFTGEELLDRPGLSTVSIAGDQAEMIMVTFRLMPAFGGPEKTIARQSPKLTTDAAVKPLQDLL